MVSYLSSISTIGHHQQFQLLQQQQNNVHKSMPITSKKIELSIMVVTHAPEKMTLTVNRKVVFKSLIL
jgi:hypothetical protein